MQEASPSKAVLQNMIGSLAGPSTGGVLVWSQWLPRVSQWLLPLSSPMFSGSYCGLGGILRHPQLPKPF